jgi:hypothetical protein
MVTVKKSMLIMALEHGGYVVKEHDVYNNKTDMLFAGSLGDCLNFLRAALQQKESKMITTTLNKIRAHNPCEDGWEKLLKGFGKTKADDEPLPFVQILEINGLDDALWCLRAEPQYAKEYRLLAVAYARHVQHLNPDPRVKNAIDVAERYANGEATDEELTAAKAAARAAWDDAGYAAARAAAGDYAGSAAGAA